MQLGMIGLGRMGANMVRRLINDSHECVVFDSSAASVSACNCPNGHAKLICNRGLPGSLEERLGARRVERGRRRAVFVREMIDVREHAQVRRQPWPVATGVPPPYWPSQRAPRRQRHAASASGQIGRRRPR